MLVDKITMNAWYLPSVPTTLLTFKDVCKGYQDLFIQMARQNVA